MAQRKTVYRLNWNPSKATVIAALLALFATIFLPSWLELPISGNAAILIFLELVFAMGLVLFFFEGLPRIQQLKVLMVYLSFFAVMGTISNLFHQATFLGSGALLSDFAIVVIINLSALALTLSTYRLAPDPDAAQAAPAPPDYLSIPPQYMSIAMAVIMLFLMVYADYLPIHTTFTANIVLAVCALLFATIGGSFYFLRSMPRPVKLKMGFVMLGLSLVYGTIGNTIHHNFIIRPGWRVELSAREVVIMNAAAILIVLSYFLWQRFVDSVKAKLVAEAEAAAAGAPGSEPQKIAASTAPQADATTGAAAKDAPGGQADTASSEADEAGDKVKKEGGKKSKVTSTKKKPS